MADTASLPPQRDSALGMHGPHGGLYMPVAQGPLQAHASPRLVSVRMVLSSITALALVAVVTVLGTAQPARPTAPLAAADEQFWVAQHRSASKQLYQLVHGSELSFYDEGRDVLGTTELSRNMYSRQPYVANGYIGSRVPNVGFGYAADEENIWTDASVPGALNNGWPLRNPRYAGSFVSDFYSLQARLNSTNFPELDEEGYSTVIASIPEWTDLRVRADGAELGAETVALEDMGGYVQNMSLADGVVTTEYVWRGLSVRATVAAHRSEYPLGLVQLEVALCGDTEPREVEVRDVLNFTTSHRTVLREAGHDEDGIYMRVEPENVPYSEAALYSVFEVRGGEGSVQPERAAAGATVAQWVRVRLTAAQPRVVVRKYVGVVSSEYNTAGGSNLEAARAAALAHYGAFDGALVSHRAAWSALYGNASIEIPSDFLLELAAKSSMFHMLANTRAHNVSATRGLPVPVTGLSSDSYGGMVFWDSDVWMLPGLLPFFPDIAREISNYRNATHAQAVANARHYNYSGALYPWTSGRYANCTSTGPCVDYEYHINIDIAMSSLSIYMNGADGIGEDYLRYTTWPLLRDAALFFTEYVRYNETLDAYTTHNLTDPDEFANFIDNGAFTNAGIKILLRWAIDVGTHLEEPVDTKWQEISDKIHIPTSETNITLEYTGMNATVDIKQADVLLMVYPLGYITDESILNNAIQNLYYYSERQSASGPAMTYPVFAAAAATLLNHGSSSQSYLYKAVVPYLRAPFFQFSEQSDDNFLTNGLTQPAFPFLTANGGYLQSLLFGLTGLRYSYTVNPETKKMERLLKFSPVRMPLLPGGIRINNFKYLGQVLDISIDDHNATIAHKQGNTPIHIKVPDRSILRDRDVPVYKGSALQARDVIPYHELSNSNYFTVNPGETLTLPVYEPELNIQGNIVEGRQITNLTQGVPGDVPISILDGNNYTHWQPFDKSERALLLIDLGSEEEYEITTGKILWGARPAKNFSISILPNSKHITEILTKLTAMMDGRNTDLVSCSKCHAVSSSQHLLGGLANVTDSKGLAAIDGETVDMGIREIFRWNLFDLPTISSIIPEAANISESFVTVLENYQVTPSEPYYEEVVRKSQIVILPSNETDFCIDYAAVPKLNPTYTAVNLSADDTNWRKTRFVIVAVEGSYDDDDDQKGGTIKEIALMVAPKN
ncbi:AGL271Wp [Eremothecium gossypii ATCC 10895]|uniref:alpha,alpha-trehalase n=1 Tax=Eremothecium gossypii (strain ATCC 10895 / CBS 109.51 / FGSC 9923 / NRRL Y-1056) TaxID=284811 RepID=Q751H7_EREGS|nr:AGL271Wp [Eremothecium gossypii ATCC 10895]AAS54220.1 AGL271Wp [Eremothecium gossypii ATCC 10895]AEY98546.1 FAGL271Wp [Eremothecium gossypii FDAG1]